jgi:hypothetical protein
VREKITKSGNELGGDRFGLGKRKYIQKEKKKRERKVLLQRNWS